MSKPMTSRIAVYINGKIDLQSKGKEDYSLNNWKDFQFNGKQDYRLNNEEFPINSQQDYGFN